jgi:hypothetical protein
MGWRLGKGWADGWRSVPLGKGGSICSERVISASFGPLLAAGMPRWQRSTATDGCHRGFAACGRGYTECVTGGFCVLLLYLVTMDFDSLWLLLQQQYVTEPRHQKHLPLLHLFPKGSTVIYLPSPPQSPAHPPAHTPHACPPARSFRPPTAHPRVQPRLPVRTHGSSAPPPARPPVARLPAWARVHSRARPPNTRPSHL